jgi:hypothetical protein
LTSSTPTVSDPNRSIASYRLGAVNGIGMRWLVSFTWSERFVVLVAETAVAYLAFVFGLLVGAALFG